MHLWLTANLQPLLIPTAGFSEAHLNLESYHNPHTHPQHTYLSLGWTSLHLIHTSKVVMAIGVL